MKPIDMFNVFVTGVGDKLWHEYIKHADVYYVFLITLWESLAKEIE